MSKRKIETVKLSALPLEQGDLKKPKQERQTKKVIQELRNISDGFNFFERINTSLGNVDTTLEEISGSIGHINIPTADLAAVEFYLERMNTHISSNLNTMNSTMKSLVTNTESISVYLESIDESLQTIATSATTIAHKTALEQQNLQ